MILRPATVGDRDALLAMTAHFIATTPYGRWLAPTAASVNDLIDLIFEQGDRGVILLACDAAGPFGMLAMVALTLPLTGDEYAEELCWWVEPTRRRGRAGPALLHAGERWARTKGLRFVKMVAPVPSTVGRFYERLGYQARETTYTKALP